MLPTALRGCLVAIAVMLLAEPALAKGQKYAILIGVHKYESTALRPLPYAENDVTVMAKVLQEKGFDKDDVILMTATEGARSNPRMTPRAKHIRRQLDLYLSLPEKGDVALIALSGHGVQFKGDDEHYFCPIDADLKNKENLISVTELYKQLDQCKADIKLLFVDACRNDPLSGNAPKSASDKVASKTRPTLPDPPGGIGAFFSCSKGQEAFESGELKHGVFFHFLLEGLRGKASNRDGEMTIGDLVTYVSRQVPRYAVRQLSVKQRPELLGRINLDVSLDGVERKTTSRPGDSSTTKEKTLSKTKTITLPGGVKMEFVLVPKGTFWMETFGDGDFNPKNAQKQVKIDKPFYIGKYEVTQEQWQAVMGINPSGHSRLGERKEQMKEISDSGLKRFPVERVAWYQCQDFFKKLNTHTKEEGFTLGLPSEAQWEYACRAASQNKAACSFDFYMTKPTNDLSSREANFDGDSPGGSAPKGLDLDRPTPVGSYAPNALGIYDMHGNVSEWCQDTFSNKSSYRVIRGGSWNDNAGRLKAAALSEKSCEMLVARVLGGREEVLLA